MPRAKPASEAINVTAPRYSVIVPAYNSGKTIAQCLRALAHQSLSASEYEVILVDDGSNDNTAELVRGFSVRYLRQMNHGPAAARNHGAREARGELVLFTDSDCVPDRDWIAEMVKPFSDPEVVAVKGAYRTNQRSLFARFAQVEFEERFELLKRAPSIDMVDTYSAAYRKTVFDGVGGFDESFPAANNEDTELSYKLSRMGRKMIFNPDALVYHLNHPDSLRRYARLKFWRGYWRMVVYRRYPDKMMKDTYTPQTLKFQILFLFILLGLLPGMLLWPAYVGWPFGVALLLYAVSMTPFALLAIKRDIIIGAFSPYFLSLRAASLGLGFVWGILLREKGRTLP
jgi:cellulose synthase/poly-beta-1,6-N-acetylglucosamine synthase-like glycosyltransferase